MKKICLMAQIQNESGFKEKITERYPEDKFTRGLADVLSGRARASVRIQCTGGFADMRGGKS